MYGIAICWPANDGHRIARVAESGRIPSFGFPKQATIPGSPVALVAPNGTVQLYCKLGRVLGPQRVRTADGKVRDRGYLLIAQPRTLRVCPKMPEMNIRWRSIGQIRYFDVASGRAEVIDAPKDGGTFLKDAPFERDGEIRFKKYGGGIPGLDRSHPEARLVDRYVTWIGSPEHFHHAQALPEGGYTDLFNVTRWTLFEAKASSDDRKIREAFGQLYDYRRWFARSPSLALLLPDRPLPRMYQFLKHFGVAAVWENSRRTFADNVEGRLTSELRSSYRTRRE